MAERDYRTELRKVADHLRDPMKMRLVVCGVVVAIAYFGIYSPLNAHIDIASRKLREVETRNAAARDVEFLRAQVAMVEPRLAAGDDTNECVQYVLDGIRSLPVKLMGLDCESTVTIGPYEAVRLLVEVRGSAADLDALLAWFETNERLFRIDSIKLEPSRMETDQATLHLVLLCLKVRK